YRAAPIAGHGRAGHRNRRGVADGHGHGGIPLAALALALREPVQIGDVHDPRRSRGRGAHLASWGRLVPGAVLGGDAVAVAGPVGETRIGIGAHRGIHPCVRVAVDLVTGHGVGVVVPVEVDRAV